MEYDKYQWSFQGFLKLTFEFIWGVINVHTAVATQWSIKRSQWVRRAVWFCGPVAHWWCSCLYGPVALKRFNKILYLAIFMHWMKYGFREDKMIDTRIMTKAVIYVIFTLLGSRVIPGQVQVLFRTAVFSLCDCYIVRCLTACIQKGL